MYLRMDLHVLLRYLYLASNCLVQKKDELGSCLAIVATQRVSFGTAVPTLF